MATLYRKPLPPDLEAALDKLVKDRVPVDLEMKPWSTVQGRLAKDAILSKLIAMNKISFAETNNPLFAWMSLSIGHFLSAERYNELNWCYEYIMDSADALSKYVEQNDRAGTNPPKAIAESLGFRIDRNVDPFREVHSEAQDQKFFLFISTSHESGMTITRSIGECAEKYGVSVSVAKRGYARTRDRFLRRRPSDI